MQRSRAREDGVGGQRHAKTQLFGPVNRICSPGCIATECLRLGELVGVERVEELLVCQRIGPVDAGELRPEGILIALAAIVSHHGGRTRPDGVCQRLGLVAARRCLGCQQFEVAVGELILVHGEQRAVQVEQDRLDL